MFILEKAIIIPITEKAKNEKSCTKQLTKKSIATIAQLIINLLST
jgi:hypothetical protein